MDVQNHVNDTQGLTTKSFREFNRTLTRNVKSRDPSASSDQAASRRRHVIALVVAVANMWRLYESMKCTTCELRKHDTNKLSSAKENSTSLQSMIDELIKLGVRHSCQRAWWEKNAARMQSNLHGTSRTRWLQCALSAGVAWKPHLSPGLWSKYPPPSFDSQAYWGGP